jgi:hypothetical protein
LRNPEQPVSQEFKNKKKKKEKQLQTTYKNSIVPIKTYLGFHYKQTSSWKKNKKQQEPCK